MASARRRRRNQASTSTAVSAPSKSAAKSAGVVCLCPFIGNAYRCRQNHGTPIGMGPPAATQDPENAAQATEEQVVDEFVPRRRKQPGRDRPRAKIEQRKHQRHAQQQGQQAQSPWRKDKRRQQTAKSGSATHCRHPCIITSPERTVPIADLYRKKPSVQSAIRYRKPDHPSGHHVRHPAYTPG